MKIQGYFDKHYEPVAPFVEAMIISKSQGLQNMIDFHIDTGASVTLMLDKDVQKLGINVTKLKRSKIKIGGIGGLVPTYVIEDAELAFKTDKGKLHLEKLRLFVGKHEISRLSEEEKKKVMILPSLIGRDILHRFRFVYDKNNNELYFER